MRLGNRSPVGTPSEAIDRNFTVHDANTGMGQQKNGCTRCKHGNGSAKNGCSIGDSLTAATYSMRANVNCNDRGWVSVYNEASADQ
jgi:hypothetical protein